MPGTKIQDEAEIIRWLDEGRTYAWMAREYDRKYHLRVVGSMFSNFRQRRGLDRRIQRDDVLIPWAVKAEHRHDYHVTMLRAAARERAGTIADADRDRLTSWVAKLVADDSVVRYEPEAGFTLVPRRPGVDLDLIHTPDRPTTTRRAAGGSTPRPNDDTAAFRLVDADHLQAMTDAAASRLAMDRARLALARGRGDTRTSATLATSHAYTRGVLDVLQLLAGSPSSAELDDVLNAD